LPILSANTENCLQVAVSTMDIRGVSPNVWTVLKDDTGEYPGARVAALFAEQHNIYDGAGRPKDITVGELAIIFANTDKAFE